MRSLSLFIALCAAAPNADALEYEASVSQAFFTQSLPDEMVYALFRVPRSTRTDLSRTTYQIHGQASLTGRPTDVLGLRLSLDTGPIELDGGGLHPDNDLVLGLMQDSLLLGETYIEAQLGEAGVLQIRAGKLLTTVGHRALFSSYALGVSLDWDPSFADRDAALRLHASALLVDPSITATGKTNPLFTAEIGWAFDSDFVVWLTSSVFVDTDGGFAPVLADATYRRRITDFSAALGVQERSFNIPSRSTLLERYDLGAYGYDLQTSGVMTWTGARIELVRDRFAIDVAVLVQAGEVEARVSPNAALGEAIDAFKGVNRGVDALVRTHLSDPSEHIRNLSVFTEATGVYQITDALLAGLFVLYVSGDDGLIEIDARTETVLDHSFVSLAPRLIHTSIFFGGGASSTLTFPSVTSVAPDGGGLIALGARAEVRPWDAVGVEAIVAWFHSAGGRTFIDTTGTLEDGGGSYGTEIDLVVHARIAPWLSVFADSGLFLPGRYYGPDVPLAYQVLTSAKLSIE